MEFCARKLLVFMQIRECLRKIFFATGNGVVLWTHLQGILVTCGKVFRGSGVKNGGKPKLGREKGG
jgi:hypothetical protein